MPVASGHSDGAAPTCQQSSTNFTNCVTPIRVPEPPERFCPSGPGAFIGVVLVKACRISWAATTM
eukprot:11583125-Alexandrium_andersonii.AAC.1